MTAHHTKNKKLLHATLAGLCLLIIHPTTVLASCRTISGTITADCSWNNSFGTDAENTSNTIRGVLETGEDSSNISSISIAQGATVTIGAFDTVIVGEIDLSGESGSIAIVDGGMIKPSATLWYSSTACDGAPVAAKSQPPGYFGCASCETGDWECDGVCVRKRYRPGCTGDTTDLEYEYLRDGQICDGGEIKSSTSCGYGNWSCSSSCQRTRPHYTCNGTGSCTDYAYSETVNISTNKVCSSGNESTGYCSYGSWSCSNVCTLSRARYRCNGLGSCSYHADNQLSYCGSLQYCSSNSCQSGVCGPKNYGCYNGTCRNLIQPLTCAELGGSCIDSMLCISPGYQCTGPSDCELCCCAPQYY